MKTNNPNQAIKTTNLQALKSQTLLPAGMVSSLEISQTVYRELDKVPVQNFDVIEQINLQLATIAEKQEKIGFLMREVSYLIKR
jgi:hypothetical protein